MARLVLMCGLPGSGKTTVAMELARSLPAVRLCPDEWMAELGADGYDAATRQRVEVLQRSLALELLGLGTNVVYEAGVWQRRERDELRLAARSAGAQVELRFLDAPVEELQRRIRARNDAVPPGSFAVDPDDLPSWSALIERPDATELALFDPPA